MFKLVNGKLLTAISLTLLLFFTLVPYGRVDGNVPNRSDIKVTSENVSSLSKKQRDTLGKMVLPYSSNNITNLTFLNMTVNTTLKNGSKFMFSSPNEAILNITAEITNENESLIPNITFIQNTSCFLYHDIIRKLEENETRTNETIREGNITLSQNKSVPGYKLFFSKMRDSHPNFTTLYNGSLVPVNAKEYLDRTYGEQYSKTFLYGSIPLPNVTSIDNETKNATYFTGNENLLLYINSSNKEITQNILQTAKKVKKATDANILAIDTNNNETLLQDLQDDLNISFPMALDSNTSLPGLCTNNTSSVFGTRGGFPLLIFLHAPKESGSGLIWRKAIGWESSDKIIAYIEAFTKGIENKENKIGTNVYPIWGISAENLEPGKIANITVNLGEGTGKIKAKMNYTFFDKNEKVILKRSNRSVTRRDSKLKGSIIVPEKEKGPKKLTVTVHVKSHGVSLWRTKSFTIELEKKEKEKPWGVYAGITIAFIILIIGVLLNRKMGKEKTKS